MRKTIDEGIYENDEIMAQLGRELIDQYIGWCRKFGEPQDLTGWASFAKMYMENYLEEGEQQWKKEN